jgi:hypothetical protein
MNMSESNESSEVVEMEQGAMITPLSEIGPITVRRLTDEYVSALEKLTGSALIEVRVDVKRECERGTWGRIVADVIVGAETNVRTR